MDIKEKINNFNESCAVVLYMKGSPDFPQCGFSAQAIAILRDCKVSFETHNVLEDEALRQGIKEYSNWPTIPQLYVNSNFVGGCDIMMEMYESGELQDLLSSSAGSSSV